MLRWTTDLSMMKVRVVRSSMVKAKSLMEKTPRMNQTNSQL